MAARFAAASSPLDFGFPFPENNLPIFFSTMVVATVIPYIFEGACCRYSNSTLEALLTDVCDAQLEVGVLGSGFRSWERKFRPKRPTDIIGKPTIAVLFLL